MSGGMGSGRGGHMFGGDDTGPTKPAGAALPLLRRAAKFFGPYRARLSVIGLAIIGSSILGLANPYLLKLLIDEAIPQRDLGLIVERGRHEELRAKGGLYAELAAVQFGLQR